MTHESRAPFEESDLVGTGGYSARRIIEPTGSEADDPYEGLMEKRILMDISTSVLEQFRKHNGIAVIRVEDLAGSLNIYDDDLHEVDKQQIIGFVADAVKSITDQHSEHDAKLDALDAAENSTF